MKTEFLNTTAAAKVLRDAYRNKGSWLIYLPPGQSSQAIAEALTCQLLAAPAGSLRLMGGGDCLPGLLALASKSALRRGALQRLLRRATGKTVRIDAGRDVVVCAASDSQEDAFLFWLSSMIEAQPRACARQVWQASILQREPATV